MWSRGVLDYFTTCTIAESGLAMTLNSTFAYHYSIVNQDHDYKRQTLIATDMPIQIFLLLTHNRMERSKQTCYVLL